MGDFILDFRPAGDRHLDAAMADLKFMAHTQAARLEHPSFTLLLTTTDDTSLWGSYRAPDGTLVAAAGRISMDESDWRAGEKVPGEGGLAGKALYHRFQRGGLPALEALGGNCVLLVHDPAAAQFHLITDLAGAFPAFRLEGSGGLVFGSHPDVLAHAAGVAGELDEVSMTEFLMTSTVTPPHTFYRYLRVMDPGTVTTFSLQPPTVRQAGARRYFDLSLQLDPRRSEADLAEELAAAIRKSVRRRTVARFGRIAVALSGGLDSRAILACVEDPGRAFAFCCYNEPNRELAVAQAIAAAQGVDFRPWQRPFEYYADSAALGVRISGGMGTLANNHFLGMVPRLQEQGADTLLTGCYCDYLFKGLPLNRTSHWLTGRERLAPFRHQFYFSHRLRPTPLAGPIRERLESRVPPEFQSQDSPQKVFQVEAHRTFPLCYEGDNQQRVVPQRVAGWYLPMADRDVLEVYRRIPWQFKLNRSVYTRAVRSLCRGGLARVPDANTGARVGASVVAETLAVNWSRLRRKFRPAKSISTDGSWPDWSYYLRHSRRLEDLWRTPNARAADFFARVLSPADLRPHAADYAGPDTFFFVALLSLKLWFDEWHGP